MDDWVDVEKPVEVDLPIRSLESSKSDNKAVKFYAIIEQAALERHKRFNSPIFYVAHTNEPLYTTFLNTLPSELQQDYACSACRKFVDRYGNLAFVNDDGTLEPLLWSTSDVKSDAELSKIFAPALDAVHQRFANGRVYQRFDIVDRTREIGSEMKGGFTHMRLRFPESCVRKEELAGITSATTGELASMLDRVLSDYSLDTIRKAYSMLKEHKLMYADNHKASAKWLLDLVEENKMAKAKGEATRWNLLCRYAASSFVGSLKQLRSGALSVLLGNIKANCSWAYIQASWNGLCDSTRYLRPQAAPTQGNIQAAERLFEQLGITKDDLRRRLLVQNEVPEDVLIWSSDKLKKKKKGQVESQNTVFGSVKAKDKFAPLSIHDDTPPVKITFTRFVNQVLPKVKSLHCWLGRTTPIATFITGFENSKPLMQWHSEGDKNLTSHYLHTVPPAVEKHNLKSFAWNEVRCLIPFPWLWDGAPLTTTFPLVDPDGDGGSAYKYYHKKEGFRYLFVLEENHESNLGFLPLFPEFLKSEFHGVRSTIEAYSRNGKIDDIEDGFSKGGFVGGVEATRGSDDQELKMRAQFYQGTAETYHITLFE